MSSEFVAPEPPWKPAPFPEKGDSHVNQIFQGIGYALNQWNRFEVHVSQLFVFFIMADADSQAARRAFGAVRTFEGRLDMCRATAETYFNFFPFGRYQDRFDKLAGTAWKEFGARRNEIAHGLVQNFPIFPPSAEPTWCLGPAPHDYKKTYLSNRLKYCYTSDALTFYGNKFSELSDFPIVLARKILERGKTMVGEIPEHEHDAIP